MRFFEEPAARKRPYLSPPWFAAILAAPPQRFIQPDGRIRWWGRVIDPRDGQHRVLRLATLEGRETIHNAYFDRGYREGPP
jgi:hypothetical protein